MVDEETVDSTDYTSVSIIDEDVEIISVNNLPLYASSRTSPYVPERKVSKHQQLSIEDMGSTHIEEG